MLGRGAYVLPDRGVHSAVHDPGYRQEDALLEVQQRILLPVRVGDTVRANVEVLDNRSTSRGGRAVVKSQIDIYNQREEMVITYTASRLLSGRVDKSDPA